MTQIALKPQDYGAVVTMRLEPDAQVSIDSTVSVHTDGLFGGNARNDRADKGATGWLFTILYDTKAGAGIGSSHRNDRGIGCRRLYRRCMFARRANIGQHCTRAHRLAFLHHNLEQRAFRRLSAFAGGFTLDAASRVGGGQRPGEVLDDITSLINKSLVRQIESNGEPRLGMLETIREFGLEQLAQANEIEAVYRAHAAYYLSLAEESEPHLTGREQKVWLNRLRREQDNLRVALRWGVEQHETEFVLRLVGALWQYWFLRGQWSEGRRWFEEVLALTTNKGADKTLQAKAMFAAANLIRRQYDFTRARALCEQSATLYREAGDREGLLAALNELCRILDYQGDAEAARAALPEILALAEGLPDLPIKAEVYAMLHTHASGGVNSEKGARYLAESERIYRALDSPAGLATVLIFQGAGADFRGDTARGRALRDEAERLAAEVEDQPLRLLLLSARVVSAWQSGDYVTARSYLEQLIGAGLKVGAGAGRPALYLGQRNLFLGILAAVLHGQGLSAWAARVYGLADKLAPISESATMGGELFDAFRKQTLSVRAEVRLQLGDEAFAKELAEGRAMRVEDLLAIPHPDSPSLWPSSLYEPLTGRELEVLILLAQDLSNPQIAERLVVSRRTVDAHLRSIYQKLGVRSRDGAIRLALEYGLLENRHAR